MPCEGFLTSKTFTARISLHQLPHSENLPCLLHSEPLCRITRLSSNPVQRAHHVNYSFWELDNAVGTSNIHNKQQHLEHRPSCQERASFILIPSPQFVQPAPSLVEHKVCGEGVMEGCSYRHAFQSSLTLSCVSGLCKMRKLEDLPTPAQL